MAEIPTERIKIAWFWKSNADPFDESQIAKWERYSDLEIDWIEENYQNKEKYVDLGDYRVDLKKMVQYRKSDPNRQRPIKREGIDSRQYIRRDRCCIAEKPILLSKSFGQPGDFYENAKFIDDWKNKHEDLCSSRDYSKIIEQAAQGIIHEGCLLEKEFEGQRIAAKLRKVKHENLKQIHDVCVHVYSMNTFLYGLLIEAMRNEDMSKVDTLGPFSYLLTLNLYDDDKEDSIVYRGCYLSDDMINDYKNSVGKQIIWSSFTSLSRSEEEAEKFVKNAMFIVRITGHVYCSKYIASLSRYPDEQEVLLRPVHPMWVVKYEYNNAKKRHVIYLNDDPDYWQKQSSKSSS
ncbi:unnamed protein product [Adineta ricciae]|uniref:NAD(P)(+)--arginine ADP-ribosyltransferase n=1 Tax=Adineta ricciae TaxID=249248 RepID=A0A815A261_ADIRI|nr:unnamed protein product [Adineta ricciae]